MIWNATRFVAVVLAVCAASPTSAQVAYNANIAPKTELSRNAAGARYSEVERLSFADRVRQYAQTTKTTEAYLVAASLYQDMSQLRAAGGAPARDAAPDGFWAETEQALANSAPSLAMLQRIRARQSKGLVGGVSNSVMQTGAAHAQTMRFTGGEPAVIYARPQQGGRQLRLTVFDQNGASVCRTEWRETGSICRWTPRWTGPFRVLVEGNNGALSADVITN